MVVQHTAAFIALSILCARLSDVCSVDLAVDVLVSTSTRLLDSACPSIIPQALPLVIYQHQYGCPLSASHLSSTMDHLPSRP
ncbi:hypothetical protein C8Q72DRAFT_199249 [Fomitopsis betulina]|nr:hypothetical protein C8Q72DRAFT_199249 [Fomitopsis betulina]